MAFLKNTAFPRVPFYYGMRLTMIEEHLGSGNLDTVQDTSFQGKKPY